MKETLSNAVLNEMLHQLQPILSHRNRVGYIAARNYRIIKDCLTEYQLFRDDLIKKYGEIDKDENGNVLSTISIKVGSPNFKQFCDELEPLNNMKQDVDLMKARYVDVIGCLSGEEILGIDWMLED